MNSIFKIVVDLLTNLIPIVGSFAPAAMQSTIAMLEAIVPAVGREAQDLIAPVQNIIAALQGSGIVTHEQVAALQVQSAALDAALDAAAADDGLTGILA